MTALLIIVSALVVAIYLTIKREKKDNILSQQFTQELQQQPKNNVLSQAEREAARQAEEVFDDETYLSILNGHYQGPLPEHIVGSHWTDLYPDKYRTKIAGINFRKGIKHMAHTYFDAMLYPDTKNEYDPNAIKIVSMDYKHLGYVPAIETSSVRSFIEDNLPYPCRAFIGESSDFNGTYLYGRIVIDRPDSLPKTNHQDLQYNSETPKVSPSNS